MSFLSNLLDATPGVGHVKGLIHYAVGDIEAGNKAIIQATRTAAVMAGGAAGAALGGPAGAVAGAMCGGCLSDTVSSAVTDKPQGIVRHCANVSDDIEHGRNPTASLGCTGMHLALDAVGGVGMGGVSSATANSVSKKIASNVGEQFIEKTVQITAEEFAKLTARKATETVVKKTIEKTAGKAMIQATAAIFHIVEHAALETAVEDRKNAEQEKNERQATKKENNDKKADKEKKGGKKTDRKTSESETNTKTGSGSQPPEKKKGNKKPDGCNNPDIFSEFLKLLKEILESICGKENQEKFYGVFENLSPGQIKSLVRLIKKLKYFGTLEVVLKLVIQIFYRYFPRDFTFPNFLSQMEFVKTYLNIKIEEKCMITSPSALLFKQCIAYLITVVAGDFDILKKIFVTFNNIRVQIESENANEPVNPNFRDIFSAVYHYFKHRIVPGDGTFSVKQYYCWIRRLIRKVRRLQEWPHLEDPRNPRYQIIYELYVEELGRRIKIVVKMQGGIIVLSSVYVVSDNDEEGDVFIS